MINREQLRAFIDHPVVEWSIFVLGVLLMIASIPVGALPGPGGIFVFAAGLALVLKTSMFAPVVTRFVTYGVKVPPFAAAYMEAVLHRADVVEWIELAQEEPWVIEEYESAPAA